MRRADNEHARGRQQRVQEDFSVRRFLQLAFAAGEGLAAALDISQETVQGHVKKILRTLEVNDRTAAVTVAIRRGIIRLD
mgnify:CR=1 FL=1